MDREGVKTGAEEARLADGQVDGVGARGAERLADAPRGGERQDESRADGAAHLRGGCVRRRRKM